MAKGDCNYLVTSDIVDLIADESGYYKYEVDDIYRSMLRVFRKLFLQNQPVNFGGMFMVDFQDSKIREFFSPREQKMVQSIGGKRMRLRNSGRFNEYIKNVSLGRITLDEALALSNREWYDDRLKQDSIDRIHRKKERKRLYRERQLKKAGANLNAE